ncbi:MAG TPA: hypothetical protein VG900_03140 [Hyphomicrobiaceae bacterium]|nr:hypothetical protein [Hyphomicrobiaceae bacterium]
MALSTAQIGRCGELLVQYELLLLGVESAPLSTDAGVDLVAYSPKSQEAQTIQVKSNYKAKPSGGKGKAALDWWITEDNPAQLVALVDLSSKRLWLFLKQELAILAQQRSSGRLHIYMYTDPTHKPKKTGRLAHMYEFEKYRLEHRAHDLFGV